MNLKIDVFRLMTMVSIREDASRNNPHLIFGNSVGPLMPGPRAVPLGEEFDDMDTSSSTGSAVGASSREGRQKYRELLVPRGLDLLPSMRAPRYLLARISATGKDNSGTAAESGQKAGEAQEYVPWIGGSASLGSGSSAGQKRGVATAAAAAAPVRASDGIEEDRVQWFPRGLPKEVTMAGRGQDERESAMYNTRVSVAIDRLGEQVGETAKRQAEMEVKRREKVRSRPVWLA